MLAHELEARCLLEVLSVLVERATADIHVEDSMAGFIFWRQTILSGSEKDKLEVGVADDSTYCQPEAEVGIGVGVAVDDEDPGKIIVEIWYQDLD